MIGLIAAAVFPAFVLTLIGFGWAKAGNTLDPKALTPIVAQLSVPCLTFATLVQVDIPLDQLAVSALGAALVIALTAAAAVALLLAMRLSLKAYLPALTFSNVGNLGLSLSGSAFGPSGLGFALIFFVIGSIGANTIGPAIAAGTKNWAQALRAPVVWALAAALIVKLSGFVLTDALIKTLAMLGALAIPMMLLMLGASLATIKLHSFWRPFWLACARLGGGIAIGFGVAALLGLSGPQKATLVMQSSMPTAVINYLYAQIYDNEPAEIAGLVVISTLLSVVTTPLLLAVLLSG